MRAIDADRLKEVIDRNFYGYGWDDLAKQLVDAQPTIDPVKHGHWILDETINNPRYQIKTCSLCGCRVNGTQFNFCPSCGARMSDKVSDKVSDKLLNTISPCKHCGQMPEHRRWYYLHYFMCTKCVVGTSYYETVEKAAKVWNKHN